MGDKAQVAALVASVLQAHGRIAVLVNHAGISQAAAFLDVTPADYKVGQPVELLVAGVTPMGFKAIINNRHWGLIHKNEVFKFLRSGMHEKGFIKEVRHDGKIALSLQPVGAALADSLQSPDFRKKMEASGSTVASPNVNIDQFLTTEVAKYKKIVEFAKIEE